MFLEELLQRKIISQKDKERLEQKIRLSGKREEEVILEEGILPESELFSLKSLKLGIPLAKVNLEKIDPEILNIIPEETANFYKFVPLSKIGNQIEVGMVYPEDVGAKEALNFLALSKNFRFNITLITPSDFQKIIRLYHKKKEEIGKTIKKLEEELKIEIPTKPSTPEEIIKVAEEAPVSKAVAAILRYALEGGASDIHIEPGTEQTRVRYRVLGKLYSSIFLPIKVHPAIVSRIKILSHLRIDETRIPQDGRFSIDFEGRRIDFRVSTFPTAFGEKIAIRILDPKMGLKKLDELGLSQENYETMQRAISQPFGMILITGPTGSGKTTTLYAILQILNKESVNIVTLEDPIEYLIPGINQSQINPQIGYTFASGLRQILRQDPDVIMIGEIRDRETAELAIHAALTGHLVLSTLHTNNVVGTIPRLIDLGIQPFLIPPSLNLIVAQRLVRVLCPKCKKAKKPTLGIKELILKELEEMPPEAAKKYRPPSDFKIYEPVGCPECGGKGFVGRIGIFEVLEITDDWAEIILKEPSESKILEKAKKQGMITMRQDGMLKVLNGLTTIEEVLKETG